MNVLSRIVGMKKLCVVLGGLGLLSTGAWAQDSGYIQVRLVKVAPMANHLPTARKACRLASRAHCRPRDQGARRARLVRLNPTWARA